MNRTIGIRLQEFFMRLCFHGKVLPGFTNVDTRQPCTFVVHHGNLPVWCNGLFKWKQKHNNGGQ